MLVQTRLNKKNPTMHGLDRSFRRDVHSGQKMFNCALGGCISKIY